MALIFNFRVRGKLFGRREAAKTDILGSCTSLSIKNSGQVVLHTAAVALLKSNNVS